MRTTLLLLTLIIVGISDQSCRKRNFTDRSPCEDSTLRALYERRQTLTHEEYIVFDSLYAKCEKHTAVEENRGKLWPGILAGIAIVAAVGTVLLWLALGNHGDIE